MSWSEAELRRLYISEKKSSADIAKLSKCSEHKVNYWLEKHLITKRSISEAIYSKRNPNGDPFLVRRAKTLSEAKLLGFGLGLYWGEGNKRNANSIRLGNTSPGLIKKFIEFLIKIFGVEKTKLRFGLQVFGDMSSKKTLDFWLNELKEFGVTRQQFFKITVTPPRSIGNYREKSKFGVLTVHFANSKLKRIIDSMLPM
ncbi:MAG: hypothetical protein Q8P49_02825 [Candidatus Liptonbacteria bacterium]|nr:hypothetical protein [Candidatus Liptonbacteria bacterium]